MKKYRILYWFGSMVTEFVVKADNAEEAEKKFRETKGNKTIVEIKES